VSIRWHVFFSLAVCAVCMVPLGPAFAKPSGGDHAIVASERLSKYLLRQGFTPEHYLEGLCWSTQETRLQQADRHRALLTAFSRVQADLSPLASQAALAQWHRTVHRMVPMGCVPLAEVDPQRLAIQPNQDPVLRSSDEVKVPRRPTAVAVVSSDGSLCRVAHAPGASAQAYLRACSLRSRQERTGDRETVVDRVWLIQPQSKVAQSIGVGRWNESAQDSPAPGAWLWVPMAQSTNSANWFGESDPWPVRLSQLWLDYLLAQGVFTDDPEIQIQSLGDDRVYQANRLADLSITASDWGVTGLLQTPSARFPKAGQASISFSKTHPYGRLNFMLSPFDWLEAGFRYVDISNRAYGVSTTGQSNKDKSIDVKLRLLEESRVLPALAVGIRDMGGTGLFSGEYLVGNKRVGSFDWSLGMGWGYLGARGDVGNPLGGIFSGFKKRPGSTESAGTGGQFNTSTYFRGSAAWFGGVQYQAPNSKWIWKAEIEGNNYQSEPQANDQTQRTPLNVGFVYRWAPYMDLTAGIERGSRLMFGLTLRTDLSSLSTPKLDDPPLFKLSEPRSKEGLSQAGNWAYSDIRSALQEQTRWQISHLETRDRSLRVVIEATDHYDWATVLDRANLVLDQMAPSDVTTFVYVVYERGLPLNEFYVDRMTWALPKSQLPRPDIRLRQPQVDQSVSWQEPVRPSMRDQVKLQTQGSPWTAGLGFAWAQSFGGPDAFMLYQLSAKAEAQWQLSRSAWIYGAAEYGLIDNYDQFSYTGTSRLPRVRTYAREYVVSSNFRIPNLQANQTFKVGDHWYGQVYGGLLEPMFGGVGGEVLYRPRPFDGPWAPFVRRFALGVDLNRVRQRGFEQNFEWRPYDVTTGHATLYWDTGWQGVQLKASVGQYLAGDKGATLDVSRVFANGLSIGAFATKTNVSSTDFGEGAFDKGIYVSIPFDVMMTRSTKSVAKILWRPLTRDGGAKLTRLNELIDLTSLRSAD
jgi:hypothetical protein